MIMPRYQSTEIDAAATCNEVQSHTASGGQHDRRRPQSARRDLGAIEAGRTFGNGFDE